MTRAAPPAITSAAFAIGRNLALDIFELWRRDLECVDALILLEITMGNVGGILFSRELTARYGGAEPIAPDHLRQPVSIPILANSLGLLEDDVRRRLVALGERGECQVTANGMVITSRQVDVTNRTFIVRAIYEQLRLSYERLRGTGLFSFVPLPPSLAAHSQPVRAAAAHGGKYMARLLGALASHVGDVADALLVLRIMRENDGGQGRRRGPPSTKPPAPARRRRPADPKRAAEALGLDSDEADRRIGALIARQVFELANAGVLAGVRAQPWFARVSHRNVDHLLRLFAGLAEVGALADFDAR
jgi:hypothetical protein